MAQRFHLFRARREAWRRALRACARLLLPRRPRRRRCRISIRRTGDGRTGMNSLALRLRFVTEKTEATRRHQGFLVIGEKLQQLELLLRCKRRRVVDRPRRRRRPATSEGGHVCLLNRFQ